MLARFCFGTVLDRAASTGRPARPTTRHV
jgi:hypothetical protein